MNKSSKARADNPLGGIARFCMYGLLAVAASSWAQQDSENGAPLVESQASVEQQEPVDQEPVDQESVEQEQASANLRSANPRSSSQTTSHQSTPSGSYVLQLIASLLVVLVAFAVLAWIVKRFNRLPGSGGRHMQVLTAMSLGARDRAVLVQVGKTQMLLGVSPGRVATLHVFDEPVVDVADQANTGSSFAAIISNLSKGAKSQPDSNQADSKKGGQP